MKIVNPEVAELLGAFIGDGWIEARGTAFYITGDRIEDRDYYDYFLGPLFGRHFVSVKPRDFKFWRVYGIACYKKNIISKLKGLGFQSGEKSTSAKIPAEIMSCKESRYIKSILRGIFDADGSFWCEKSNTKTSTSWKRIHHYKPELQIGSCSKILLEQITCLLTKLGVSSSIRLKNKKGKQCGRNVNEHHVLKIRKICDIKGWFEVIGSSNPRHQTRYAVWEKFGFLPPYTNINQRKAMLAGQLDPNSFYS